MRSVKSRVRYTVGAVHSCRTSIIGLIGTAGKEKRLPIARHQGQLPAEHSFVQVQADNLVATTIKRAEHDGAVILRFYNWTGKEGDVSI